MKEVRFWQKVHEETVKAHEEGINVNGNHNMKPIIEQVAINYPQSIELKDDNNMNALEYAVMTSHAIGVEILLKHGANLNIQMASRYLTPNNQMMPLVDVARLLLEFKTRIIPNPLDQRMQKIYDLIVSHLEKQHLDEKVSEPKTSKKVKM